MNKSIFDSILSGQIESKYKTDYKVIQQSNGGNLVGVAKSQYRKSERLSGAEVQNPVDVNFRSAPQLSKDEDIRAANVVNDLINNGLVIKNTISVSNSKNNHSVYYEVVSKGGDTFLISVPDYDKSEVVYISGKDGDDYKASMIIKSDSTVFPIKNVEYASCNADPICSSIYSCNEETRTCSNSKSQIVTNFQKVVQDNDIISTVHYGDNPMAYPLVSYYSFVNNPKDVSRKVALMCQEIRSRVMKSNLNMVKNATTSFNDMSTKVLALTDTISQTENFLQDSTEFANKLIDQYYTKDTLSLEQQQKLNILKNKKITYSTISNNIYRMNTKMKKELEKIDSIKVDMIGYSVKLFIQTKLRLSTTFDGKNQFLPKSFTDLSSTELENIFVGNREILTRCFKDFIGVVNNSQLFVSMNVVNKIDNFTNLMSLVADIKSVGIESILINMDNAAEQMAIWENIMAVIIFYEIVEKVSPKIIDMVEKNVNKSACKGEAVCLDYDKENKTVTFTKGGNLSSLDVYDDSATAPATAENSVSSALTRKIALEIEKDLF